MLTFTASKAILKTQTTGTEKPDAPLRGMRWKLNVPALQPSYFNAQVGYHFTTDSSLSLFVGQRRGALRCVGGICRIFPPFEGASLDAVVRF